MIKKTSLVFLIAFTALAVGCNGNGGNGDDAGHDPDVLGDDADAAGDADIIPDTADADGTADTTPGDDGDTPLVIVTTSLTSGIAGAAYSAPVEAAGGSGSGYSWEIIDGSLPPGLALSSGTPAAAISGTPTERGEYGFVIQVTDSESAAASRGLTIFIASEGLYVDHLITADTCVDYDPAARSCGGGSETAYRTLAGAAAAAGPGDTVLIREGTYEERLVPGSSGTEGNYVTYRNYGEEQVVLTGSFDPAAIHLDGVDYVAIEGLTVDEARWLEAENAHHVILRGNSFLRTPASGTTGNVRFISSHYNRILDNVISDGNDNLLLIDSEHNLVEGNRITEGRHSVWGIRCGDYNVIRGNVFSNTQQKIGEVYDCGEDTSAVPNSFQSTTHNLVENNVFADASSYYSTSGGNGIQYAGQDGIIRRNVFYACNVGLGMQIYSDEAEYNERNRVYHNVFFENECGGISVRGGCVDNVFKNNILAGNMGWSEDCSGDGPAQLLYRGPLEGFAFIGNDFFHDAAGEDVILEEFGSGAALADFESAYPDVFMDNLEILPMFVDGAGRDFSLQSGSGLVDAAVFLTTAAGSSTGTVMAVADARWFYDGFGIPGERGDEIQLEGGTERAVVTAVDYGAGTLTLDRDLTWTDGQGVALVYTGSAPDVGAFERP
jgi:hypothetical protein